jgi:hypothetical protein
VKRSLATVDRVVGRVGVALSRTITTRTAVASWLVGAGLLIGLVEALHGPTDGDAFTSVYSAWSLAHGNLVCAYPATGQVWYPVHAPPIYVLFSSGVVGLFHIGGSVRFPSPAALGVRCRNGDWLISQWELHARALSPTLKIGFVAVPLLIAGAVALVRACGRGKTRWEPVVVISVACLPPVVACLAQYFHPQDLIAIAACLGAAAAARTGRPLLAGVLLGLGFESQQLALLALVPIVVLLPVRPRLRLLVGAAGAAAIVALPLAVATHGHSLVSSVLGSADGTAGTWLVRTGLTGSGLTFISRFAPLACVAILAGVTVQRMRTCALDALPLTALLAAAFALRLLFEIYAWGYYFAAAATCLVILEAVRGCIRIIFIAWIALLVVAWQLGGFADGGGVWTWQLALVTPALWLSIRALVEAWGSAHAGLTGSS